MKKIILILAIASLSSCTKNQRARWFGGTETINLPEGQVFLNATWKDSWFGQTMWISTFEPSTGKSYFYENSSFGLIEGKIEFTQTQFVNGNPLLDSTKYHY